MFCKLLVRETTAVLLHLPSGPLKNCSGLELVSRCEPSIYQPVEARCSSLVRAFAHGAMGRRIDPSMVDPLSYFSFQPVLHDWCTKGHGMCYPACGMVLIKEPLLLIGVAHVEAAGFLSRYMCGTLP